MREALGVGARERNARTGSQVLVLPPMSVTVSLARGELPLLRRRLTRPRTAAAEVAWFVSGNPQLAMLHEFGVRIWDKFSKPGPFGVEAECSYGERWRRHFGRDQLRLALDALTADRSDRRVLVSAWDPARDGLGSPGQVNVPCPACFTLSVRAGVVDSTLLLRSSDLFVGLPYDAMGHALLVDAVSRSLDLAPGRMQLSIAHPHLYEQHWEMARDYLEAGGVVPVVRLPGWRVEGIESQPREYVDAVDRLAGRTPWPAYNPKPEVVQ